MPVRARYLSRQAVEQKYTRCAAVDERHGALRAGRRCRRPDRAPSARRACGTSRPRRAAGRSTPSTMPSTRRQNARATKMTRTMNRTSRAASGTRLLRAPPRRMRRLQAVERALGGLPFGAVRRERRPPAATPASAPSRSCLPNALHDADVQQRLGVLRIELQRVVELLERLVRLVRVVVADAEVGADVDVLRRRASARRRTT